MTGMRAFGILAKPSALPRAFSANQEPGCYAPPDFFTSSFCVSLVLGVRVFVVVRGDDGVFLSLVMGAEPGTPGDLEKSECNGIFTATSKKNK